MANGTVTNKELYDAVDGMRKELKVDILRVETKFDTMEAGRLSRLEREFATLQGKLIAGMFIFGVALQILFFLGNKFIQ